MQRDDYATDDAMVEAAAARHGGDDEEFDALVTFANSLGFYCNKHRVFDRN